MSFDCKKIHKRINMIHLIRNTLNNMYITASELMLDTDNDLLITFTNEMTKSSYSLTLGSNISPARGRYDEFEIDLPNDIDLPLNGFYIYDVYEIDSLTQENLGIVETGRCSVTGEFETGVDGVYL